MKERKTLSLFMSTEFTFWVNY